MRFCAQLQALVVTSLRIPSCVTRLHITAIGLRHHTQAHTSEGPNISDLQHDKHTNIYPMTEPKGLGIAAVKHLDANL